MLEIKFLYNVGDPVKYVPGEGHMPDLGADGLPCFHYHYGDKLSNGAPHPKAGQAVEDHVIREAPPAVRLNQGGQRKLMLGMRDETITPGRPRSDWDAKITAINPDGTVNIWFKHPNGMLVNTALNLKVVDAALEDKPLHTCYLVPK